MNKKWCKHCSLTSQQDHLLLDGMVQISTYCMLHTICSSILFWYWHYGNCFQNPSRASKSASALGLIASWQRFPNLFMLGPIRRGIIILRPNSYFTVVKKLSFQSFAIHNWRGFYMYSVFICKTLTYLECKQINKRICVRQLVLFKISAESNVTT